MTGSFSQHICIYIVVVIRVLALRGSEVTALFQKKVLWMVTDHKH